MTARKVKPKRSRFLRILLIPFVVVIGLIGWLLVSLGEPKKHDKPKQVKTKVEDKKEPVTLVPMIEETPEVTEEELKN